MNNLKVPVEVGEATISIVNDIRSKNKIPSKYIEDPKPFIEIFSIAVFEKYILNDFKLSQWQQIFSDEECEFLLDWITENYKQRKKTPSIVFKALIKNE